MSTYFVVRDTNHPDEDLKRNWSATIGGFSIGEWAGLEFSSKEDAVKYWNKFYQGEVTAPEFRYHPAWNGFVEVHYEGLGAWVLDADNVHEAIEEASEFSDDLAVTTEKGDGHFYAEDVVAFHKVREGKYVFEIKS